jgi:hypothetical protein
MIFLHLILGVFLGKFFRHYAAFILGAVFADLDHIYIYFIKGGLRWKNFSWKKLLDFIKYEERFGFKSKTPLFHSILGLIVFSAMTYILFGQEVVFFAIAYLSHLLLDWLDKDEKYLLYPWKLRFKGFAPVWSRTEQVITAVSLAALAVLYLI